MSEQELIDKLNLLKLKAKTVREERARAQTQLNKLELQQEQLNERLQTLFNLTSWSEAKELLSKLEKDAQRSLQEVQEALAKAGAL